MARIALFDDDEVVRMTTSRMLERAGGFEVLSFEDGADALSMDFSAIDLVITDFFMPTPGDEVIKELRRRGLTLPLMVLSGTIEAGDREMLERIGADCVMEKPMPIDELVAAVRKLLSET